MPQKITKTVSSLVKEALAEVPAISAEEAISLAESDTHVFVDLRDGVEQARGIIPGAVASSRGLMEFILTQIVQRIIQLSIRTRHIYSIARQVVDRPWPPRSLLIWVFRRWLTLPAVLPLGPRLVARLNRRLGLK